MPYIGHNPTNAGSFIFLDDIASGFNNSETDFTLQVGGVSVTPNTQNLLIALDGVIQQAPDAYTVSGSTISFTAAVPSGTDFYGILMGQSASIGLGTIGADELKISGNGTNGQLIKTDGDGTFSYINQNSVTASTAATLATARTINGVSFDGSGNITVTADANTLSNTTLKSTVVNSSLTSVGTLTSLNVSGQADIASDTYPQLTLDGTDNSGNIGINFVGSGSRGGIQWNGSNNNVEILREDGTAEIKVTYNSGTTFANSVTTTGAVTANGSDYMLKAVNSSTTDGHASRISAETGIAQGKIELDFFNSSSTEGGGYGMIQVGKTANTPPLSIMAVGVGIGAVPRQYYKLDLYKNGNACILGLRSESHGCTQYFQTGTTVTGQLEFSTSHGWLTTRTNVPLKLGVNNTPRLTLGTSEAEINYDLKTTGHITVDTGGTSIITADGNNTSGDDGRLILKGHTAGTSRAYAYFNNGVTSGGLNWYVGNLRGSNRFTITCGNDDHPSYGAGSYNDTVIDIDSNRKVGIGNSPSSQKLRVYNDATDYTVLFQNNQGDGAVLDLYASASDDHDFDPIFRVRTDAQNLFMIDNKGNWYSGDNFVSNPWDLTSGEGGLYFRTGYNNSGQTFAIANNQDRGYANMYSNAINADATDGRHIQWMNDGTPAGHIHFNSSNSVAYNTTQSDKTLKKNFADWTESVLDSFDKINPQLFHFKIQKDSEEKVKGFIAQEMIDKFPEAYPMGAYGEGDSKETKYHFNPSGMVVYLMKAVKELSDKIKVLEAN